MKRIVPIVLLALVLGAGAASAVSGVSLSGGAFGGVSIPILQDDSKQGVIYGLRLPVSVLPLLKVEPYWAMTSLGDAEETFGTLAYTRDGGKVTAYGVNALLSLGGPVRFFPFAGIASHKLTREGTEDLNKIGYNFGLGLGFSPIPKFDVDVRGELNMITLGETSRKFANVTAGVSYRFLSLP
jgi:opacity protein-like surface antigen